MFILPLLAFIITLLIINKNIFCWRNSFLYASILWGLNIAISTEILSLFHGLKYSLLSGFWIAIALMSFIVLLKTPSPQSSKTKKTHIPNHERILLGSIGIVIIFIGITALFAPPNNWDSMTYHMSRVMHWKQNHSIAHYPTAIIRQLTYTPWAEFAITHFQILSHSDHLANLIQWFSMVGSLIGVSLIAKQFQANRYGQILSAVAAATIPMGILQGSSTQNDYVGAFWLICFIYFALRSLSSLQWPNIFSAGAALGLALLTKGTVYIYAIPFCLWFFLLGAKNHQWKIIKPLLTILALALLINTGYYARNSSLTGHALPGPESPSAKNETINLSALTSNTLQNVALELGTPFKKINNFIEHKVHNLHTLLKIDITNPRTSLGNGFKFAGHPFHEDHAGSPVYIAFIISTFTLFIFSKHQRKIHILFSYFTTITIAFLLFSLLIKWQPWGNRLHLPILILYAPFIGIILSRISNRYISIFIIFTLLILSLPWIFLNQSRPLIGGKNIFTNSRTQQYFTNRPGFSKPYGKTAEYLKSESCTNIGLILGEDSWEYPLWHLMKKNNNNSIRMEHINVKNISANLNKIPPFNRFTPCAIISFNDNLKNKMTFKNHTYIETRKFSFIHIFIKDENGALARKNTITHFFQRMKTNQQAKRMEQEKNFIEMINYKKEELNEARLIDINELNKIYTSLGDHFQSLLLPGLELRIAGYATGDKMKHAAGQKLIILWEMWFQKNRKAIWEAFKR